MLKAKEFPRKRFTTKYASKGRYTTIKAWRCLTCANCMIQPTVDFRRDEHKAAPIPENLIGLALCIISPRQLRLSIDCPSYSKSPLGIGEPIGHNDMYGKPLFAGDMIRIFQDGYEYEGYVIDEMTAGRDSKMEDDFAFPPIWEKTKKIG